MYPLFLLVQAGDVESLEQAFAIEVEAFPTVGRITSSKHKQYEYLAVSLVNSFMVGAILAGAYPPEANWIADRALRRISTFRGPREIPGIAREAALELCSLVRDAKRQDTGNVYVEQAKHYLVTHLTQEIRNEDIARHVGLSPSYLARLFKAHTGRTMRDYLTNERVQMAKHLLAANELPLSRIASMLGFCDQSYFTAVFRKGTGITPRQYRNTHQHRTSYRGYSLHQSAKKK